MKYKNLKEESTLNLEQINNLLLNTNFNQNQINLLSEIFTKNFDQKLNKNDYIKFMLNITVNNTISSILSFENDFQLIDSKLKRGYLDMYQFILAFHLSTCFNSFNEKKLDYLFKFLQLNSNETLSKEEIKHILHKLIQIDTNNKKSILIDELLFKNNSNNATLYEIVAGINLIKNDLMRTTSGFTTNIKKKFSFSKFFKLSQLKAPLI